MSLAERIGRAAFQGAIVFALVWIAAAFWNGIDHGYTIAALLAAAVCAVLMFLRSFVVEHLERRFSPSAPRPSFLDIIRAIRTIVRDGKHPN